jgi:hypothetical protein
MMKNKKDLDKKITILIENLIIWSIIIIISAFIIAIIRDYWIYHIVGAHKYFGITQPIPLTNEELVELLQSKGIGPCKHWPREYPTLEERPCYIKGVDRDGDKYCDVVVTAEQSTSGLTNSFCSTFWDKIKNK